MDEAKVARKNQIRDRILSGDVWRTVWWLSWPSVLTMSFQTVNGLADVWFVARLGESAVSGVGVANQIMMIILALGTAVSVGSTAIVARFIGADDPKQACQAVRQSIILAVVVALVTGLAAFLVAPSIMRMVLNRPAGIHQGVLYLNILLLAIIPYYLMIILTGVYRGMGDTRTPLIVMVAMTVVSLVGDYVLIFGIGPFPRLGVAGAGIATASSRLVATIMFLAYLPGSHLGASMRGSWKPVWSWFGRILNIGMPAAVQGFLRTGAMIVFYKIVGLTAQGDAGIAALTIGLRMESISYLPGFAFSVAATSMVGQNLGARQPDRAERGAWAATWQGVALMGAVGLSFMLLASPIASLFTKEAEVRALAAQYLLINGVSQPFMALGMVFTGALQGAGQTRLPTWATVLTLWFIRIPVTYYLGVVVGLGTVGAFAAMSGSAILNGLAILGLFKFGSWKDTEI